ncbi:Uncharacterised protein [uncultured archaeon]|nr:Uncharacterised protein [uncultured archaeon]
MKEEFERMSFDQKVSYLVDNLRNLPDDLSEEGIEILVKAGETEYAAVLAREKGMIDRAIKILKDSGDFLWAALMAKNAGREGESEFLLREGLDYYIGMEMFGRAVSASTALQLPAEEIDSIFRRGIESESRGLDLAHSRDMIDSAMESLDIALIGKNDETSRKVLHALNEERDKRAKDEQRARNQES